MNFLERLVAEWYGYKGFFVRMNIKFGRRTKGGWEGEMDVIAYEPGSHKLVHVETSTDADALSKRRQKFRRKFSTAKKRYLEIFPYKGDFEQIAIIGLSRRPPALDIPDVKVKSIPQFLNETASELEKHSPISSAISETYPLLRAIQYAVAFVADRNKPNRRTSTTVR